MCSAFTPDCGYDNSTFILIGDVYCPNTKCSGRLCLHKRTFQSLGRSDYEGPQCRPVCQVRNAPFEDQTISFFLSLAMGFTFLKRAQNQFKILLSWQVSSRGQSWGGGLGGRPSCIKIGYSSRELRGVSHPSRELSGDVILDSDWMTTRVT